MCKRGRDTSFGHSIIETTKRKFRRKVKLKIRKGDYDNIPVSISVPYTD